MKYTRYRIQDSRFRIRKINTVAIRGSEQGIVLVVALLLLLVATVVGITALSTSTTTVMISGNQRLSEINFRAADSCIYIASSIIKASLANQSTVPTIYSTDPDFTQLDLTFPSEAELDSDCPAQSPGCSSPSPDLQYTSGTVTVSADFDNGYTIFSRVGSSMLMLHCYDGSGQCAKDSSAQIWYITCVAEGPLGSQATVCGTYQYVPREE